ncbi:MAG: hypothetical protein ACI8RZ_000043 [Myxococcota bacterium]|jgi:hypothetical protein
MSVLSLLIGTALADVQVSVSELSVDGLQVRSLECTLDKGGFLAAATVVGSLAQQDDALDACSQEGAAFSVQWTWGAASDAVVLTSSRPSADVCIQSILKTTTSSLNGQCTAVILVGEEVAAAAAATALATAASPPATP